MNEPNAKTFAMDKIREISEITYDLERVNNKELLRSGIKRIQYLVDRLPEHLEYLDIRSDIKEKTN